VHSVDNQDNSAGGFGSPGAPASTSGRTLAELRTKGRTHWVPSVQLAGSSLICRGKLLRIAAVPDEDLVEGESVVDPESLVALMKKGQLRADILTFAQRLPDMEPKYRFYFEWENVAAVKVTTFSHWWKDCTEYSVRKAVNRSKRLGVVAKRVEFDDDFCAAIWRIYRDTPIRQGKAFWHYKKDVSAVKRELATYVDRSIFLGAYYENELIGSMKMIRVGPAASIMQIFCSSRHFDKRPNNALIAKAIEICEEERMQYLIYGSFVYYDSASTLTEFKRRNGFQPVLLPRYYVPLTIKGRLALRLGVHHGILGKVPEPLLRWFLRGRRLWNAWRHGGAAVAS